MRKQFFLDLLLVDFKRYIMAAGVENFLGGMARGAGQVLQGLAQGVAQVAQQFVYTPEELRRARDAATGCKAAKIALVIAAIAITALCVSNFGFVALFAGGLSLVLVRDFYKVADNLQYIFENPLLFDLHRVLQRNVFNRNDQNNDDEVIRRRVLQDTLLLGLVRV
jgi:hypothetical protein